MNPDIEYHRHDYRYNRNSGPIYQLPPRPVDTTEDGGRVRTDIKEEGPFTTSQTAYDISFKGIWSIYNRYPSTPRDTDDMR